MTGSGLFEAFGAPVGATGTSVPFGFVGGADCQTEADTGLVLMGHRYYDSRIGRFLTPDPIGDGANWYAYAGNNPVNKTDPMGLSMGLPGQLGAPDQRYGGAFGGGLGEGPSDDFWGSQDNAIQRGSDAYRAFVGVHQIADFIISNSQQVRAGTGDDSITATVREAVRRSVEDPQGAYRELQDLLDEAGGTFEKKTINTIKDGQKQIQRNYNLGDYVSAFRQGKIIKEFPRYSELQNMTVKQVLKQGWSKADLNKVEKLLFDGRFAK